MSDQVFSIEQIKRNAREAAECGEGPDACKYEHGSEPAMIWRDAFYVHVYELSGEATA
ncbi:MAG TPA: hypothetical protein VJ654_14185 [Noviherbaspirillum sp.]|nr:hypothetical protein [Noviherbaspirillum sp.]